MADDHQREAAVRERITAAGGAHKAPLPALPTWRFSEDRGPVLAVRAT
jgi:hypothetical protein